MLLARLDIPSLPHSLPLPAPCLHSSRRLLFVHSRPGFKLDQLHESTPHRRVFFPGRFVAIIFQTANMMHIKVNFVPRTKHKSQISKLLPNSKLESPKSFHRPRRAQGAWIGGCRRLGAFRHQLALACVQRCCESLRLSTAHECPRRLGCSTRVLCVTRFIGVSDVGRKHTVTRYIRPDVAMDGGLRPAAAAKADAHHEH